MKYFYANVFLTIADTIYGIWNGRSLKAHAIYIPINLLIGLPFQVGGFIYVFVSTFNKGIK